MGKKLVGSILPPDALSIVKEHERSACKSSTTKDGPSLGPVNLLGSTNVKNLQTLSLSHNKITGDGFRQLAELSNLTMLFLHHNPVTDEGVEHLSKMKSLRYLGLLGTAVSPTAAERLKMSLPNCEIEHRPFLGQ